MSAVYKIRCYCQKLPYFVVMHDAFIKLKKFWNPCYDVSFIKIHVKEPGNGLTSNNTDVTIFFSALQYFLSMKDRIAVKTTVIMSTGCRQEAAVTFTL